MSDQEIRFRVILDDAGMPASATRAAASLQSVGDAASRAGKVGQISAGQTAAAFRTLPAQFTDIVTQLQGGASPFTVLLQQGGQIKDSFGGFRPAAQALVRALTPAGVAFGAVGVAAAVFAAAVYQGHEESQRLAKSLALTGDAAGKTRGQLQAMASVLAAQSNAPIGQAREAVESLAASGAFVGDSMDAAGRAVLALQRLSGLSAQDIVRDFASMRDGVAAWAATHNRSYNYLTAAQVTYIRSLEAQGRTQDAMRVNLEALAVSMEQRAVPALGTLERAIESVKRAGSGFWDWLKDFGRDDTVEQQLATVSKQLAYMRTTIFRSDEQELVQRQAFLQEELRLRRRGAEAKAQANEEEQRKILEASRGFVDAQLGEEAAGQAKALAESIRGSQARRLQADADYRERIISAKEYTEAIIAGEREKLDAELKGAQQSLAIERRRVTEKPQDELNRRRAILAAETNIVAVLARRDQLEARIKANELRVGPDASVYSSPLGLDDKTEAQIRRLERAQELYSLQQQGLFRRSELSGGGADVAQKFAAEQRAQAYEQAHQLLEINRQLSADILVDDRARGLAQIAIEEEQMRKRLNLAALSADDRKRVEEDFAQWRVLKERELTEQLKPQWQRDAELWADTTRDMKQRYDTFMGGFVDTGRETFQTWLKGGKASTKQLVDFIGTQFGNLVYDRFLSGAVRSAGNALFDTLLGSVGGGGFGALAGVEAGGSGLTVAGARAGGGGVQAGQTYLVGERGPELLTLGASSGYVTPNGQIGGQPMHIDASVHIGAVGAGVSMAEVHAVATRAAAASRESLLRTLRQQGRG